MTKNIDRFGNPIDLGDVIAYSGANIGLIVGVVVKFNPASYKVKVKEKNYRGEIVDRYYNVMFSARSDILTAKGMNSFKPENILNELEMLRLGLSQ